MMMDNGAFQAPAKAITGHQKPMLSGLPGAARALTRPRLVRADREPGEASRAPGTAAPERVGEAAPWVQGPPWRSPAAQAFCLGGHDGSRNRVGCLGRRRTLA